MDYSNYFLNIKPSSAYAFFVAELLPLSVAYKNYMQTTTGIPINKRRSKNLNTFCMNMRDLARSLSSEVDINSRHIIYVDANIEKFKPLFVSAFDDDLGSNVYSKLNSFYPLTIDNHLKFSGQLYNNNLTFAPLISDTSNNEQLLAEKTLYKASIMPMMPLAFISTIDAHESFGPSFLSSFSISLSAIGSIPMVDIRCSFVGSKLIKIIKPSFKITPTIETKDIITLPVAGSGTSGGIGTSSESSYNFKNVYRSATIIDCLFDPNECHTSLNNLKRKMSSISNINNVSRDRIVEISMEVSNEIEMVYTQPTFGYVIMDDNVGPTFAKLNSRTVKGSFTVYSIEPNYITPSYEGGVTFYFGGPFFYPIKKVNFNNPTTEIKPGGGYLHKITFTAKLPYMTGFYVDNLPVSEFNINFGTLRRL